MSLFVGFKGGDRALCHLWEHTMFEQVSSYYLVTRLMLDPWSKGVWLREMRLNDLLSPWFEDFVDKVFDALALAELS